MRTGSKTTMAVKVGFLLLVTVYCSLFTVLLSSTGCYTPGPGDKSALEIHDQFLPPINFFSTTNSPATAK